MSSQYLVGDVLTLTIEKVVPRGFGLAFAEKLTVFVPLAAPGDIVSARITHLKKRTAFAEIIQVLSPGPDRVVPHCPYFGTCGGCNFQQLSYDAQLRAKLDIIYDCLQRIGKIKLESRIRIIGSPRSYDYRSRVRWQMDVSQGRFGYFRRDSNDVVDVEICPVLAEPLKGVLQGIRGSIEWNRFDDPCVTVAASGDAEQVSIRSTAGIDRAETVTCSAAGEAYDFSAEAFFQANQLLLTDLIELAVNGAAGDTALDLYAGVGLFALPLARRFKQVIAVEGDHVAVEFAHRNAERAGLDNIRVIRDGVGRFLLQKEWKADFVLIDPPRSGTEREVIDSIIKLHPREISYVSCEPSILARDLRTLIAGGYVIASITALDLFPQTHHVETVVRLRRLREPSTNGI